MSSIFLCHSSRDKFFVRKLAEELRSAGVRVWLDEAEIKIGDSLQDRIGQALDDMQFVGVVLSTNSIASPWVQKELQIAMSREFKDGKVVLPLLLEPVEIPAFLRDKLYADFTDTERFDETFPTLLDALGVSRESQPALLDPVEQSVDKQATHFTRAERSLAEFEDIGIVDLDLDASYNPDETRKLWNMYIRLSQIPPSEWVEIFSSERQFPRHSMWRRAWIEGSHIVVYCVPEELEKYHLRDLVSDTGNSNKRYREYLAEQAQKESRKRERLKKQDRSLQEMKKRLGFK